MMAARSLPKPFGRTLSRAGMASLHRARSLVRLTAACALALAALGGTDSLSSVYGQEAGAVSRATARITLIVPERRPVSEPTRAQPVSVMSSGAETALCLRRDQTVGYAVTARSAEPDHAFVLRDAAGRSIAYSVAFRRISDGTPVPMSPGAPIRNIEPNEGDCTGSATPRVSFAVAPSDRAAAARSAYAGALYLLVASE